MLDVPRKEKYDNIKQLRLWRGRTSNCKAFKYHIWDISVALKNKIRGFKYRENEVENGYSSKQMTWILTDILFKIFGNRSILLEEWDRILNKLEIL